MRPGGGGRAGRRRSHHQGHVTEGAVHHCWRRPGGGGRAGGGGGHQGHGTGGPPLEAGNPTQMPCSQGGWTGIGWEHEICSSIAQLIYFFF